MKKVAGVIGAVGLAIVVWAVASSLYGNPRFLPQPWRVATVLWGNILGLTLLAGISGARAIGGLSAAAVVAALLTASLAIWPLFGRVVYPLALLLKATPAVAFAPILVAVLGSGWKVKIAISALIAFFPMLVTSLDTLAHVPRELRMLGTAYGASRLMRCRHIEAGWLAYGFASGLRTGAPLAVVGAIVAEFLDSTAANERGLGIFLFTNARSLFMEQVFAAALMSGLLGLLLFGACTLGTRYAAARLHLRS